MLKLGALAGQNHLLIGRIFEKAARHGRQVLESIFKREGEAGVRVSELPKPIPQVAKTLPFRGVSQWLGVQGQKIVTVTRPTLAGQLRERYAGRLRSGSGLVRGSGARGGHRYRGLANRLTMAAFVGIGMARGTTMQATPNPQDELCTQFTQLVKNTSVLVPDADPEPLQVPASLKGYQLGTMIAKGCDAAVYHARTYLDEIPEELEDSDVSMATCEQSEDASDIEVLSDGEVELPPATFTPGDKQAEIITEIDEDACVSWPGTEASDIEVLSLPHQQENSDCSFTFTQTEISEVDNSDVSMATCDQSEDASDIEVLSDEEVELPPATFTPGDAQAEIITEIDENVCVSWPGTEASDIEVLSLPHQPQSSDFTQTALLPDLEPMTNYPLAVKMMFNYDVESRAMILEQVMGRELLPAQDGGQLLGERWQTGHRSKMKRLPPHPNIVKMYGGFVDLTPQLPEGSSEYPMALPTRLWEEGLGRNATLFVVMKQYPSTLRDYLKCRPITTYTSTIMLTQLVEAVLHMSQHNIAHRDLKSNNVLVEDLGGTPRLVVTDFGHAFVGSDSDGLQQPYYSSDVSLGGNSCLMAPEIVNARPGKRRMLDYSKADLWAVGALAYELCGLPNPFYPSSSGHRLYSSNYTEQHLPLLSGGDDYFHKVVRKMLQRDPNQRPSSMMAATMLHLLLWAPRDWLVAKEPNTKPHPPSSTAVLQWLVLMTSDVICEKLGQISDDVEHSLKCQFVERANINNVMNAINLLMT